MNRRNFIKTTSLSTAGIAMGSSLLSAKILGSNQTINAAVIGVRSRGNALTKAINLCENIKNIAFCDVDEKIIERHKKFCEKELGNIPPVEKDYRKLLENKNIDLVFIATPEHLHAPIAIAALQAGKHVYVEKPCSHNPFENDLLVKAQKKYGKHVQMGNQQRSAITSQNAIQDIKDGIIGEAYSGKAWYANTRKSIGIGNEVAVPEYLDWDLWQGPAPRRPFKDNIHPYNWHWIRHWGTGEIHNNGTHEIDICRWALGVDLPASVTSNGGRLHYSGDDWEYFDTQLVNYRFPDGKIINWEGYSCNGIKRFNLGRGSLIQGTKGSIILTRGKYELFDLDGNLISTENEREKASATSDVQGFDLLTVAHVQNLINAIISGDTLKSPIADAAKSTLLCHYGNMAQDRGEVLQIDIESGFVYDKEAMKSWSREYEKGWEPTL
jgi:predicted dehydrogenase